MEEAQGDGLALQFLEGCRGDVFFDGDVMGAGLQVLAESDDVHVCGAEVAHGAGDFGGGFAKAEHEGRFGEGGGEGFGGERAGRWGCGGLGLRACDFFGLFQNLQ